MITLLSVLVLLSSVVDPSAEINSTIFTFLSSVSFHYYVYFILISCILYFLVNPAYKPNAQKPIVLSEKEKEQIIKAWKPAPLTQQEISPENELDLRTTHHAYESSKGKTVVIDGEEYLNTTSHNFLGLGQNPQVIETAVNTVKKYGTGSCGPRGFYGTIDCHLDFEREAAEFKKVEASILYSCGIATIGSAIPAFALRTDIIICDNAVNHAIQVGTYLSRSKVYYYKHNNLEALEKLMKNIKLSEEKNKTHTKNRRYVAVEGIFQNTGDICPLDKILALCKKYKFRIILDDSCAIGVLGATGRGSVEHFNLSEEDIDITLCDLGFVFCSNGGVCFGKGDVIDFQRLNGLGYCFSASNPPYLVTGAIEGFNVIDNNPEIVENLRNNCKEIRGLLRNELPEETLVFEGDDISPIIHLRLHPSKQTDSQLENSKLLQKIVDIVYNEHVLITRAKYTQDQDYLPSPSIRIGVMSDFSQNDIELIVSTISKATASVFQ
eukprot:TRINITY_DN10978_c0_g1_i1.p1 TRINITY_DN10978_c0_g1~~TRINITY_DN10978_c0_g1_i1.p1  ORF type:complete len:494 (+),score=129.02 TRINITY_DN10978_c0_g1_i1:62-1543(+)